MKQVFTFFISSFSIVMAITYAKNNLATLCHAKFEADCFEIHSSMDECSPTEVEGDTFMCKGKCMDNPRNIEKISNAPDHYKCKNMEIKSSHLYTSGIEGAIAEFGRELKSYCYVESVFNRDRSTWIYEGNYCQYNKDSIVCKKAK